MYHIVWEYEVRADQLAAFEVLYGPTGAWTQLFRSADGYRGTELYRDTARPTHFVTLDRWTSPAAFDAYIPTIREAYERLDAEGTAFTLRERRLGAFEDSPSAPPDPHMQPRPDED
jgi:quinol monooxygenase YgiN